MNWVKILVQCYCFVKGFRIRELKTRSEIKAAFDLKNKVNYDVSQLPPLPAKEDFVYPEGAAYILGAFKNKQLIGAIQLLDLTQIDAYSSKVYQKPLDFNPETTYEVKGFVVDRAFQKNINAIFNFLVYYSILFSGKTNRDKWIVVTSKVFYDKIKRRSGLETELIAVQYRYIKDDSTQSKYFKNYIDSGQINALCCYYIKMPKDGKMSHLGARFFTIAALKTLKKVKGLILPSQLIQKRAN